MKLNNIKTFSKSLIAGAVLASSSAQAMVVFNLGSNMGTSAPDINPAGGIVNFSQAGPFATGTFVPLAGSMTDPTMVTFDVTFSSTNGMVSSQDAGLGVSGGRVNGGIDNDSDPMTTPTGEQESITLSISNVVGLSAGEALAFTSLSTNFASGADETFSLNGGPDVLFSTLTNETLDLSSTPFTDLTFGAGTGGDTRFVLADFTVSIVDATTVVPEPSSTLLLGLGGLGLLARRKRTA